MAGSTQDDIGVKVLVAAGGAAGDITVTGLPANALLISVIEIETLTADVNDRTAEFTITAANTINNTGGTATTSDKLLVFYQDVSL